MALSDKNVNPQARKMATWLHAAGPNAPKSNEIEKGMNKRMFS